MTAKTIDAQIYLVNNIQFMSIFQQKRIDNFRQLLMLIGLQIITDIFTHRSLSATMDLNYGVTILEDKQ